MSITDSLLARGGSRGSPPPLTVDTVSLEPVCTARTESSYEHLLGLEVSVSLETPIPLAPKIFLPSLVCRSLSLEACAFIFLCFSKIPRDSLHETQPCLKCLATLLPQPLIFCNYRQMPTHLTSALRGKDSDLQASPLSSERGAPSGLCCCCRWNKPESGPSCGGPSQFSCQCSAP